MQTVIEIERLSKQYHLGIIGHGTLVQDMQSRWARLRGMPDPNVPLFPGGEGHENRIQGSRFWALRNIDLTVFKGEVLGIIGQNGAGKSTLFKILSRLTRPTSGTVKYRGRLAGLLEIGAGFHPELTGRENIFFTGVLLGMTRKEIVRKLDTIIDFSGFRQHIDTPVKRYSSGMRVRLAFAVAVHLEPEILLLDEVLAVGDARFQQKAVDALQQVARTQHRTVLFVSHNTAAVGRLCSRVCVLENGMLMFDGDTDEGIAFYLNRTRKIENPDRSGTVSA